MYQYILGMYWYDHFRRVSSRVSGFQMRPAYGLCETTGDWQKNARPDIRTSVPLLYTVGQVEG